MWPTVVKYRNERQEAHWASVVKEVAFAESGSELDQDFAGGTSCQSRPCFGAEAPQRAAGVQAEEFLSVSTLESATSVQG